MPYRDILVHLETYPDAVDDAAVDRAAALALALGGQACALAAHVRIPLKSSRLANFALKLNEMARTEEIRARDNADGVAARFIAALEAGGGAAERLHPECELFEISEVAARLARTRDISLLPYGAGGGAPLDVAEALLFTSGRPVVVFPREAGAGLETVLVAWDGGAPAARAVAAALPALKAARSVVVLSILNEKAGVEAVQGEELIRHLERHGVAARPQTFDAAGAKIGSVLEHVIARTGAGLLVMGAFGHSRAREFVLGGATRSMLESPPIPVLLAH